ncbi:hypothetical protein ACIP1X_05270 [Pseudomonas sp. NPDC088885]|jgi:hypothetical protein|uniref:hypothetical protein n=1 Tax=Pseudomonas sp. NPDC088885 TaxID=3364457 RepID=UPI0037FEDBD0
MSKTRFNLFRYQLLPRDRYFQGDLYGPKSVDDLIEQKNRIFADALRLPTAFKSERAEINVQKLYEDKDFFLFRVAVNRSVNLETKDFSVKSVDNWPKILVAIWNDPEIQLIAVQHRLQAFQHSRAVAKLIMKSIEEPLARHQLISSVEPLIEKRVFWDLVEKHRGKIKKVEFELVTPNMASISKALPEDLRSFAKKTNAVKSTLAIEADPGASLVLDKADPTVDGLASYTSDGGGSVSITLSGVKKKINTANEVKEIEIGDAKLDGSAEDIANILKELMK